MWTFYKKYLVRNVHIWPFYQKYFCKQVQEGHPALHTVTSQACHNYADVPYMDFLMENMVHKGHK